MSLSLEAVEAANSAEAKVIKCLESKKNFLLEAGAGAGKTHALIEALKHLISTQGSELVRLNKRVACITFTNVAAKEITGRIGNHPAVWVSTIHGFCWELIGKYQPELHKQLLSIPKWNTRINAMNIDEYRKLPIKYDLGYSKIEDDRISIGHPDLLQLTALFFALSKFKQISTSLFPYWFIDEYQDTDGTLISSLLENFVLNNGGPVIGFFGDSYQRIYSQSHGKIEAPDLEYIGKGVNFRSGTKIVDILNRMRPELVQVTANLDLPSVVKVFHTNNWNGNRLSSGHWKGDLPPAIAHETLSSVKVLLEDEEWEFSHEHTKVLMLTNNVLAKEQGYGDIAELLSTNEYLDRDHPVISFLTENVEPIILAFLEKNYGDIFSFFGKSSISIKNNKDKVVWSNDLRRLAELAANGTIGDVLSLLKETRKPMLSPDVRDLEVRLNRESQNNLNGANSPDLDKLIALKEIPYRQISALAKFLGDNTLFSTKHGVKGAEFDNVLVVLGRGWNMYNWDQFLEKTQVSASNENDQSFIRNRNLFYVACSRPKKRLALLFTQQLSENALIGLEKLFSPNPIIDLFE